MQKSIFSYMNLNNLRDQSSSEDEHENFNNDSNDVQINPPSEKTQKKWQDQHEWLIFNEELKMLCKYCKRHAISSSEYNQSSNFVTGSVNWRIQAIKQHNITQTHIKSIETENKIKSNDQKMIIDETIYKLNEENLNKVLPLLRNILWVCEEKLAFAKIPKLHDLIEDHGLQLFHHYRNEVSSKEFIIAISNVIRKEVIDILKNCNYFGISFDESEDIAKKKQLCITIRYVLKGVVKEHFLKMINIEKKNAASVFKAMADYFGTLGLMDKIIAISCDGAPAMSSMDEGVAGYFYRHKKKIFHTHCVVHKVSLCAKLLKQIQDKKPVHPIYYNISQYVYDCCSFFNQSDRIILLENNQEDEENLKLIRAVDIRFLSEYESFRRYLELYPAIVKSLEQLKRASSIATGLYSTALDAEMLLLLAGFTDILAIVHDLSKILQTRVIYYDQLKANIDSHLNSLETLFIIKDNSVQFYGFWFSNILEKLINNQPYEEVNLIKCENFNIESILKEILNIKNVIAQNLKDRFPHDIILSNFVIFNFEKIKRLKDEEVNIFGRLELQTLLNYFTSLKDKNKYYVRLGDKTFEFNGDTVFNQYFKLKNYVRSTLYNFEADNIIEMIFLNSYQFDQIILFLDLYLSIPLSSVECERTYSLMDIIKSKLRNCLGDELLDDALNISVNSRILNRQKLLNESANEWNSMKTRYFTKIFKRFNIS
jgi:hypothetical protein